MNDIEERSDQEIDERRRRRKHLSLVMSWIFLIILLLLGIIPPLFRLLGWHGIGR